MISLLGVAACSDDAAGTAESITDSGISTAATISGTGNESSTSNGTTAATSNSGTATQGDPTTDATSETGTDGTTDATTTTDATASTTDTTDTTDATTGLIPCTEAECAMGLFCNPDSGVCEPGCNDDSDCQNLTYCDVDSHTCKGCLIDGDCGLGTVCEGGECTPGCNDNQPCQGGLACCTGACVDPVSDLDNCGGCGMPCDALANADPLCDMGMCVLGPCVGTYQDCDKNPMNGCEVKGSCACDPGSTIACYTGDESTKNVGICKEGVATCNDQGTDYGPCVGEVTPLQDDLCANSKDDDCDGVVDENPDADNDGWGVCDGDCCDAVGPNCLNPNLVNPGAFEVMGNMVDDDCDSVKDNPLPVCDNANLASNSSNALDYAKAIDLCQFTTENPPKPQKKWGVISGALTRADGAGAIYANSKSIRPGFGTNIAPQFGSRLAVLSTGNAADSNDSNPPYAAFQTGLDTFADSNAPADWLAANGNQFPNAPGCPGAGSTTAFNSAQLKLRIRVPTNAQSFNVQMFFFSAEWPEYTCTNFNDLFVTLIDSTGNNNPNDKNIAIYTKNNLIYPVGVNLAKAASGLFTQCTNGTISQCGVPANYSGCTGTNLLNGTGFDVSASACGYTGRTGGGTGWLKMAGNVKGGETMEIRFDIWDTGDGVWDSLVLLDNWVWSVQASQPGVIPN